MASNGATLFKLRDLVATVTRVGRARAQVLYGVQVANNSAATCWVQLFDAAAATAVTLGTTTPDMEIQVAANVSTIVPIPAVGVTFRKGLFAASTTLEGGSVASASGVQLFAQLL